MGWIFQSLAETSLPPQHGLGGQCARTRPVLRDAVARAVGRSGGSKGPGMCAGVLRIAVPAMSSWEVCSTAWSGGVRAVPDRHERTEHGHEGLH